MNFHCVRYRFLLFILNTNVRFLVLNDTFFSFNMKQYFNFCILCLWPKKIMWNLWSKCNQFWLLPYGLDVLFSMLINELRNVRILMRVYNISKLWKICCTAWNYFLNRGIQSLPNTLIHAFFIYISLMKFSLMSKFFVCSSTISRLTD